MTSQDFSVECMQTWKPQFIAVSSKLLTNLISNLLLHLQLQVVDWLTVAIFHALINQEKSQYIYGVSDLKPSPLASSVLVS